MKKVGDIIYEIRYEFGGIDKNGVVVTKESTYGWKIIEVQENIAYLAKNDKGEIKAFPYGDY